MPYRYRLELDNQPVSAMVMTVVVGSGVRAFPMSHSLQKRSQDRVPGLSPAQVERLRAIGEDSELGYRVLLKTIYSETSRYLESLSRQVREGKAVEEAANFARWLQFSGVVDLLGKYSLPGQNFPSLDRVLNDLLQACGEHFRGGRVQPKYDASDIAEINRKLDILLASNSRSVPGSSAEVVALPLEAESAVCNAL